MLPNNLPCQETIYIIGGGASLKEIDLSLLKDKFVIGVNNAYCLGEWVRICWFGDVRWYEWNANNLRSYRGTLATCHPDFLGHEFIWSFKRRKWEGIETEQGYIAWNKCSGGSAINLAYHYGAKKIILISFDMKRNHLKENNWHSEHKIIPNFEIYNPYPGYIKAFSQIAVEAKNLGLQIIDTSIDGALSCFPKMELENVV